MWAGRGLWAKPQGPMVGQPIDHEPIVLGPALGGAVLTEREIPTGQGEDRLTRGLVEAIGGSADGLGRISKPVDYRILGSFRAAPSDRDGYARSSVRPAL